MFNELSDIGQRVSLYHCKFDVILSDEIHDQMINHPFPPSRGGNPNRIRQSGGPRKIEYPENIDLKICICN
jgi:hypothetical protein